jgi:heme exporter protein CcmD
MSVENMTHADYILLSYGFAALVLALLAVQSWHAFRAARRALDAAAAPGGESP